jgi:D-glycero-alpha-D-manno-heptose-7-phosphate kinase
MRGMNTRQITAYAPTRLDFVGGWTDVQPFCDAEAGLVVNVAFGVHTRVVVRSSAGAVTHRDKFIQAACRRFGLENVFVELTSDAPLGSGLGGSGAVGVALVGALAAYARNDLTPREIAELAHQIEVQDLDIIGGKQDQYAAAFGGFLALTFEGDRVSIQQLALDPTRVRELEARSVVVYTGQSRVSGNIHAHVQAAYRSRNAETLEALATIRRVAREFRTALQEGSPETLGELLTANWDAQKRLHASTTNAIVEKFFQIAMNEGALGGKALGAGGGGCLYFLARAGEKEPLCAALRGAGGEILSAGFDVDGLRIENKLE